MKDIRITKCYLVEYIDKSGKEIDSDFCFGSKEDAVLLGEKIKAKYEKGNDYKENTNEHQNKSIR